MIKPVDIMLSVQTRVEIFFPRVSALLEISPSLLFGRRMLSMPVELVSGWKNSRHVRVGCEVN